jgi:hypothetical protein
VHRGTEVFGVRCGFDEVVVCLKGFVLCSVIL